jgi:hypothetical protein
MTSSYLVGACTGKSAGFSPLIRRLLALEDSGGCPTPINAETEKTPHPRVTR